MSPDGAVPVGRAGGRFVQETVKGDHDGKPFEGLGLLGYDKAQKKYILNVFRTFNGQEVKAMEIVSTRKK